jgi:hypothetical protein
VFFDLALGNLRAVNARREEAGCREGEIVAGRVLVAR